MNMRAWDALTPDERLDVALLAALAVCDKPPAAWIGWARGYLSGANRSPELANLIAHASFAQPVNSTDVIQGTIMWSLARYVSLPLNLRHKLEAVPEFATIEAIDLDPGLNVDAIIDAVAMGETDRLAVFPPLSSPPLPSPPSTVHQPPSTT